VSSSVKEPEVSPAGVGSLLLEVVLSVIFATSSVLCSGEIILWLGS
jgi:hypothetical protein